jgi:hypothetical protein
MARELEGYLRASAARVQELETALADLRRPYRMEPLSHAAAAQLRLFVRTAPEQVPCGEGFQVVVDLQNHSERMLASFLPFPLHFSYRWIGRDTDAPIVVEGQRSPLRPTLLPAAAGAYTVNVAAPSEPGSYRLRVTLVQEAVMWLDSLDPPVIADVPIRIV